MEEIREINVYNLIVLDESGSMYSIRRLTASTKPLTESAKPSRRSRISGSMSQ